MSERSTSVAIATEELLSADVPGVVAGLGVDAVEIRDFERDLLGAEPATFLASVFLGSELLECGGAVDRLAARFAAKEATLKALGTGVQGIGMTDVEIRTSDAGRPSIWLAPAARLVAEQVGIRSLHLSMTREAGLAIAVVVGATEGEQA